MIKNRGPAWLIVAFAGLTLGFTAGCGGGDADPVATATAANGTPSATAAPEVTPTTTAVNTGGSGATEVAPSSTGASGAGEALGEPETTTEQVFFDFDATPGFQSLVAAAAINNHADATLEGAEVRIDLLDAAGATVGTSTFPIPKVGSRQSYVLVVQASSLGADKIHSMTFDAEPASLVATVVTPGKLVDGPGDGLTYEDLQVYASTTTPNAYELTATLVVSVPTQVGDIGYKTALVLDTQQNVVGLGLGRADTTGKALTDILPTGTRIPVAGTVLDPTAEVAFGLFNVYVEP